MMACMNEAIHIRHITVERSGTLYLEVAVALDALYVTPQMASYMLAQLPNLARHVCVNDSGPSFGDDIEGTWTAHLLEHVIIELMAQTEVAAGSLRAGEGLAGHTSWLEPLEDTRAQGVALMQVAVRFHDDFIALQACKDAVVLVTQAIAASRP